MIYLKLFWSFFQIGLFSFGGGLAAIPLIQDQVVEGYHWLTNTQFTDLITIAEMTPGPIAVNASTFVGIQIAGIPGALIATLGCIIPSCIIVSLLAFLYSRYKHLEILQGILNGLRPGVIAMIASAGVTILISSIWNNSSTGSHINNISVLIFSASLLMLRVYNTNPIYIMLGAGVLGGAIYLFI